jgi:hypothetical protein
MHYVTKSPSFWVKTHTKMKPMRTPHTCGQWHTVLQTLLLDGPLLKKLGSVADINALIGNVARKASSTIVHS